MDDCLQIDRTQYEPRASRCSRTGIVRIAETVAASAALIFIAAPAGAGTAGGKIGSISRATVNISVSVAPRVELVRSGATTVGKVADEAGLRATHPVCVWGNTALGTYKVIAMGDARKGFSMTDRAGRELAYKVEWASTGRRPQPLSSGAALEGLTAATAIRCGGGVTGGLVVKIPDVTERGFEVGFGGDLLLLVAPD